MPSIIDSSIKSSTSHCTRKKAEYIFAWKHKSQLKVSTGKESIIKGTFQLKLDRANSVRITTGAD